MIPVLREQALLAETLRYFGRLPYPGRRQVIVLTTQREIAENGNVSAGTTPELALQLVGQLNTEAPGLYRVIHYPYEVGNKASQLNYALRRLSEDGEFDPARTYIGVYDADSRPAEDTLEHVADLVAGQRDAGREWPVAIQQPSLFLNNFNEVPSWYLQLEALFETRWALGHEIRTMRASTRELPDWRAPYAYCVGHGMFIRQDFLNLTGGFPEPNEDVPMGHRLSLAGIPIHPLPAYDICDVAPSFKGLVVQSGRWFSNAPLIWKEYRRTLSLPLHIRPVRGWTLLVKGLNDTFTWMHYPLHLFALFELLLLGIPASIGLVSLAALYLDAGVGMVIMLVLLPHLQRKARLRPLRLTAARHFWFVLAAPLRGMVRGLGPLVALYYGLLALRPGTNNVMGKVERNP